MLIRNILSSKVCNTKQITKSANRAKEFEPTIKKETEKISGGQKPSFKKIKNFFTKILNAFNDKLIKINKAEIKKLSKLDPSGFLAEAQKIIAKSKNYDSGTIAPMVLQPLGNKKIAMIYDATSNIIYINTENKLKPGAMLFATLAHEYEHMHQNMQILRTKGLGAKAIDTYSELQAKNNIKIFSELYKNVKKEDMPVLKEQLGENFSFLEGFLKARDEGAEALNLWTKNAEDAEKTLIKTKWQEIQEKIIKKHGEIEQDTQKAKACKDYFDGFTKEGSITGAKKLSTRNEIEAYTSTIINFYNYIFKKFF